MKRLKKSALFRRLFSFLLALAVVGPVAGTLAVPAKAAGLSLAQLQEKYPDGSVWNNSFDGSTQCAGFARLMCYEVYGSEFYINNGGKWKKYTTVSYIDNGLKAGDLVRYKNNGVDHSVFITGVFGDQVSFGDCNANGTRNGVRWYTMKRSLLKNGFHHAYSAPYDFVAQGSPAPTPPPAPVTPELTLSASSVSMKVGQSVTIQAATKSAEAIYLDFQTTNSRPFSIRRGSWNSAGTQQPLTITGRYAGTTDLTVVMRRADTGAALASKTVPITVALSETPRVTFSPASAVMEAGSAVDVTVDIAWNGASYLEWNASRVLCSGNIERQSDTRSILHFNGVTAGSAIQYARLLDANKKELAVYQLPVTVTPRTPASVQANPASVEVEVGKQASIPITYSLGSASRGTLRYQVDHTNVCLARLAPITKAGSTTLTVSGLKTGTTGVLVGLYDGDQLLASTNVSVTVRQKETPPAVKVSPGTLSLGIGETKNLDLSWSGSVPSGAEIQIRTGAPDVADAKTVSVNPNGSARVAVTGRKEGTSYLNLLLCDRSGNALCSTQATVNVAAPAEPAKISPDVYYSGMLGLSVGKSRQISFSYSGDFAAMDYSCSEGLTVEEVSRGNGRLVLRVTAVKAGIQGVSVRLLDAQGNELDRAGYSFEVALVAVVVPPSTGNAVVSGDGAVPAEKPDDGGSSSSVSQVYPADGNWISKIDPEESSGGGTYVVTGTRVSSASGEVILVIPLDGKADVTTQSAGSSAVSIPGDLASSGSVEIKLPGNETAPAQSGETAGDSALSGTVSAVLREDGAAESSQEIVASDGTIVTASITGELRFTDVSSGKYYYDAVRWAASSGVTDGISGTTLAPDNSCPRGQVVEFMWRAMGCPEPSVKENPFTDVSAGDSYYQAALWAYGAGVTTGSTATTFSPGSTCTRGQVVTFLWRANGQPKVSGTNAFSDVSAGAYFADSVRWAVDQGITKGTTDTTFSPGNTCTRGQILTFLYRGMA